MSRWAVSPNGSVDNDRYGGMYRSPRLKNLTVPLSTVQNSRDGIASCPKKLLQKSHMLISQNATATWRRYLRMKVSERFATHINTSECSTGTQMDKGGPRRCGMK